MVTKITIDGWRRSLALAALMTAGSATGCSGQASEEELEHVGSTAEALIGVADLPNVGNNDSPAKTLAKRAHRANRTGKGLHENGFTGGTTMPSGGNMSKDDTINAFYWTPSSDPAAEVMLRLHTTTPCAQSGSDGGWWSVRKGSDQILVPGNRTNLGGVGAAGAWQSIITKPRDWVGWPSSCTGVQFDGASFDNWNGVVYWANVLWRLNPPGVSGVIQQVWVGDTFPTGSTAFGDTTVFGTNSSGAFPGTGGPYSTFAVTTPPAAIAWSSAASPTVAHYWSGGSPFFQSWSHIEADVTPGSQKNLRFDTDWSSGSPVLSPAAGTNVTADLGTTFRAAMWTKDNTTWSGSFMTQVAHKIGTGDLAEKEAAGMFRARINTTDVAGSPYGYIRDDGISTVVYRGTDKRIHEIWWNSAANVWGGDNVLPGQTLDAVGDPIGVLRPDWAGGGSSDSVIWACGPTTICEERLVLGTWFFRTIDTAAVIKDDGFGNMAMPIPNGCDLSIFYTAFDGIHRIDDPSNPWFSIPVDTTVAFNTNIQGAPAVYDLGHTTACGDQMGRSNSVVYRTKTGSTHKVIEQSGLNSPGGSNGNSYVSPSTVFSTATDTLVGDPAAFVEVGPWLNVIVVGSATHHVYQERFSGGVYNLTTLN